MHKLLKQASGNTLTMFLIQPLSIIISIIIARELGASGKGIYAFLLVLMSFCTPFFLFGFDSATYYYLSSKKYKIQDILFTVILISFSLGIFTSFCLYYVIEYELFGSILNDLKKHIVILYLCAIPFLFIYHLCQRSLMATSNFKKNNIISITRTLISIICLIIFVLVYKKLIDGIVFSVFISILVSTFIMLIVNLKLKEGSYSRKINREFIKESISYGIKSWFGNVSSLANDMLDQLLLGVLSTAEVLGLYSVSYNYSKIAIKPINGIFNVFYNKISNQKDSFVLLAKVHRLVFCIAIFISIPLMFFSKTLIVFLYGQEFLGAAKPILFLIPGLVFFMVTRRIIQVYFQANGLPAKGSIIQFSGFIVGLVSYVILIPRYNILGATIGTTLSFMVSTFLSLIFYKQITKQNILELFLFRISDFKWLYTKFFRTY